MHLDEYQNSQDIQLIKGLLDKLPRENFAILERLMRFLKILTLKRYIWHLNLIRSFVEQMTHLHETKDLDLETAWKGFRWRLKSDLQWTIESCPKSVPAPSVVSEYRSLLFMMKSDFTRAAIFTIESFKNCFHKYWHHSEINKMDAENLGIVFGPTLLRQRAEDETPASALTFSK